MLSRQNAVLDFSLRHTTAPNISELILRMKSSDTVRHTSLRLPRRRVVCVKKKRNISGLFSQSVIRQEIAHRRPSLMIVYSSRGHAIDVPQITDSVPGPLRPLRGNARYKYFSPKRHVHLFRRRHLHCRKGKLRSPAIFPNRSGPDTVL